MGLTSAWPAFRIFPSLCYLCEASMCVVALTFDAHLHQPVPLSAAVAEQAEGSVPTGHGIAWNTGVEQLISHLVARVLLQKGIWKGRWVTARLACQQQHKAPQETLHSKDKK